MLSEIAEIFYAVDEGYAPEVEGGIMYNDAAVGVEWELGESEMLLSDKDKIYAPLEQADINF